MYVETIVLRFSRLDPVPEKLLYLANRNLMTVENSGIESWTHVSADDARAAMDFPLLLTEAVKEVCGLGERFCGEAESLRLLRTRLEEGRFHLAVLGQFKRGKSTLLNALLGEPLLPTSVVPLTAIPTFLILKLRMSVLLPTQKAPLRPSTNLRFV